MQFLFHQCATTNMILFYLCYSRLLLDFNPDYRNLDFIVFHHKHLVIEVSDSEICCQFRFVFTRRMLCFKTHLWNRWWFMKFRRVGCLNSEYLVSLDWKTDRRTGASSEVMQVQIVAYLDLLGNLHLNSWLWSWNLDHPQKYKITKVRGARVKFHLHWKELAKVVGTSDQDATCLPLFRGLFRGFPSISHCEKTWR